ncbi:MAG: hypothetical protein JXA33_21020, partial [Anaerolineae bacterium]|nr:hypothetical protein [Anaerolineae bacterium]
RWQSPSNGRTRARPWLPKLWNYLSRSVLGGLVYLVIKYGYVFIAGILWLYLCCQPKLSTAPAVHCFRYKVDLTPLTFALCTDKANYRYGEAAQVSFVVTNTAAYAVTLDGGDKPALDIRQESSYWADEYPLAAASQIPLAAGSAYTIEWHWIPEQAYSVQLFQQAAAPVSVFFDGIVRYEPGSERTYSLGTKYLHDAPAPVPAANQLRGHCAGEQRAAGDLELQLCTDKRDYQHGEPVQIRWQIRNISDSPIVLDGGASAAMDIHIVEWEHLPEEEFARRVGEERRSDTHTYETRIELAPGEIRLLEWQWPTPQTNFAAVLEHRRVPGEDVARVYIYGDYSLQPGNRWSFTEDIFYALEDDK